MYYGFLVVVLLFVHDDQDCFSTFLLLFANSSSFFLFSSGETFWLNLYLKISYNTFLSIYGYRIEEALTYLYGIMYRAEMYDVPILYSRNVELEGGCLLIYGLHRTHDLHGFMGIHSFIMILSFFH